MSFPEIQFAVEAHPPGWHFPARASWIAGYFYAGPNRYLSDLRAWIDGRPVLALHGLPKPGLDERFLQRAGPPYSGFVLQINPHRGARLLRLEARDPLGHWHEFFRTPITVADDAPGFAVTSLEGKAESLIAHLLTLHAQRAGQPLGTLADEVISGAVAEPLNALPVPPFHGALEEPREFGYLHYGRLALKGWLAHRTAKIVRLSALVDAVQEAALLHGLPRSDIGEIFADLPGRETSQFLGHVDLPANACAPALVKVFAELDNGEKHLVFAQRFVPRVIAEGFVPLPPRSRTTFAKVLWALRASAARHGQSLGSARAQLAAARAAWNDYEAEAPAKRGRGNLLASPEQVRKHFGLAADRLDRPVRLLVVTHNLNFEGAPWFIFELARFFAGQPGVTVRIVSPQEGPLRRAFEAEGMAVEILDVAEVFRAGAPEEMSRALDDAHRRAAWHDVDLVIANTMVAFWAVHVAERAGRPALLYVHESSPIRRFFERLLPLSVQSFVQDAFRRAAHVVFTSDSTRVVHEGLNTARNFVLLPSWVDIERIDRFAAQHEPAALRRKHGLDPDAVLLVNIGSVCERKGQHIFVRAAELLRDELRFTYPQRKIQFLMVGARPGLYLDALQQEVKLNRLDHALFLPETGDIFDFYRLADIFVCTSFEESFPRVLLESAGFRLPIVSTNVNGIAEMLAPDEAWLIAPGDRYQLADAMKRALAAHFAGDTTRRDRARDTIVNRYHQSRSLPLHLLVARAAAARPPRG